MPKKPTWKFSLALASQILALGLTGDFTKKLPAHESAEIDTTENATASKHVTVYRGRVVDTNGDAVANATVVFNDYQQEIQAETPPKNVRQTNPDGSFKFSVEDKPSEQKGVFKPIYVWAFKPGYDLRCVSPALRKPSELELVLGESTTETFQFKHPDGDPFVATSASPYFFNLPNGCYTADKSTGLSGPLPKTIRRILSQNVAENGKVEITGVPRPLLGSVEVSSDTLSQQIIGIARRTELVSCGKLAGKIEFPPEQIPDDVTISVTIRSKRRRIAHQSTEVNADGTFSFATIPAAQANLSINWPETSSVIPLPPQNIELVAKRETNVSIPVVPAVTIRGRVVLSDTGEPVRNGRLGIRGTENASLRRTAQTNEDGWYETKMPSGTISIQLFVMRHTATHQYPGTKTLDVPVGVKRFDLELMEVDPKNVVRGFLIDKNGKRVAHRRIVVQRKTYGHLAGSSKTNEDGRFMLKLDDGDPERLLEVLREKQAGEDPTLVDRLNLKVLPASAVGNEKSMRDVIESIDSFPSFKIRSFSPVVIQLSDD